MTDIINVAIGADHAGFDYKALLTEFFKSDEEFSLVDVGTNSSESVDYPDYAHKVGLMVEEKQADFGILICGSGNGVCITANKHKNVRAALCWTVEIASLARQHNNANILCIPARFITKEIAIAMVETFLTTEFEGGRHQRRMEKINI